MNEPLIFFGAGGCGKETLAACRKRGITPVLFADNDSKKWGENIEGVVVVSPAHAKDRYPDALWVTTIHRSFGKEVRDQVRDMGCKLGSLADYLPVMDGLPSFRAFWALRWLCSPDRKTLELLDDQIIFRSTHDYDDQMPPDPVEETYFPPFIKKIENEVFVDCGACDGDTIETFLKWQPKPHAIEAFEPDPSNRERLRALPQLAQIMARIYPFAVSDHNGEVKFCANGDYSSHVAHEGITVSCCALDDLEQPSPPPRPYTFIKMDIEGAELEALWGARRILKQHKPVLAICAYHTSDHLWEIPILIHAIQPDYELRLRRYAEGARELVWYAVPKDRICTT